MRVGYNSPADESARSERMAEYVDLVVIPVPKKKLAAYTKMAKKAGKIWREHGALEYAEYAADDVKKGKETSFPQAVKQQTGEVVVCARIVYKSRAVRDKVMEKVMNDPRIEKLFEDGMPFDGMRMFWGGFKPIVSV
jgi:uncharacterized protein YbaA (DUF1428 family)